MIKYVLPYDVFGGIVRFWGTTGRQRATSEEAWLEWVHQTQPSSPTLVVFAERWVACMEHYAREQQMQVRLTARQCFNTYRGNQFSPEQLRSAMEAIIKCWHHGRSLRPWASEHHYIDY